MFPTLSFISSFFFLSFSQQKTQLCRFRPICLLNESSALQIGFFFPPMRQEAVIYNKSSDYCFSEGPFCASSSVSCSHLPISRVNACLYRARVPCHVLPAMIILLCVCRMSLFGEHSIVSTSLTFSLSRFKGCS